MFAHPTPCPPTPLFPSHRFRFHNASTHKQLYTHIILQRPINRSLLIPTTTSYCYPSPSPFTEHWVLMSIILVSHSSRRAFFGTCTISVVVTCITNGILELVKMKRSGDGGSLAHASTSSLRCEWVPGVNQARSCRIHRFRTMTGWFPVVVVCSNATYRSAGVKWKQCCYHGARALSYSPRTMVLVKRARETPLL